MLTYLYMTEETPGLSHYQIKQIVGQYTALSTSQRELLYAAFEIRDGLSREETKEMFKYLVLAKVLPQSTLDAILRRLFV